MSQGVIVSVVNEIKNNWPISKNKMFTFISLFYVDAHD